MFRDRLSSHVFALVGCGRVFCYTSHHVILKFEIEVQLDNSFYKHVSDHPPSTTPLFLQAKHPTQHPHYHQLIHINKNTNCLWFSLTQHMVLINLTKGCGPGC